MAPRAVFLATGGTGGHIFPAEAVAQKLLAAGFQPVYMTDARFQKFAHALASVRDGKAAVHVLASGGTGGGVKKKLMALPQMLQGMLQARRLIRQYQPVAIVGFGGYPSFPATVMGVLTRVPVVLHEQNAVMGRVNRLLACGAKRVALSFTDTARIPAAARERAVVVGNPVRAAVVAVREKPYPALEPQSSLNLFIMGGSQGASVFSEVVPVALAGLSPQDRQRLQIVQQCREADLASVKTQYDTAGIKAEVASFFSDVPERLAAAHLVISRAGASSVTELMAAARPAVLVPLPHAMDDHQTHNAQALVSAGGGWCVAQPEFTVGWLKELIQPCFHDPEMLLSVQKALAHQPMQEAAERLVELIKDVIHTV